MGAKSLHFHSASAVYLFSFSWWTVWRCLHTEAPLLWLRRLAQEWEGVGLRIRVSVGAPGVCSFIYTKSWVWSKEAYWLQLKEKCFSASANVMIGLPGALMYFKLSSTQDVTRGSQDSYNCLIKGTWSISGCGAHRPFKTCNVLDERSPWNDNQSIALCDPEHKNNIKYNVPLYNHL